MYEWLENLLAECAVEHPDWGTMAWPTRRRIAIKKRWLTDAQNEALQDKAAGRTAADGGKWEQMQSEIEAIKAAIPKE